MEFCAATEASGMTGGNGYAGIDSFFVGGRGFGFDEATEKSKQRRLLAARSGKQGAHGKGRI
jgi:hypothetical protein